VISLPNYYAFALSREGMDQSEIVYSYPAETAERMRAELKWAIELRPEFPESKFNRSVRLGLRNQINERQQASAWLGRQQPKGRPLNGSFTGS
jgi:hypothetical protein